MMNGSTTLAAGASSLTASLLFFSIFLSFFAFFFPLALACICLPAVLYPHECFACLQLVPVQASTPLISPNPGCSIK